MNPYAQTMNTLGRIREVEAERDQLRQHQHTLVRENKHLRGQLAHATTVNLTRVASLERRHFVSSQLLEAFQRAHTEQATSLRGACATLQRELHEVRGQAPPEPFEMTAEQFQLQIQEFKATQATRIDEIARRQRSIDYQARSYKSEYERAHSYLAGCLSGLQSEIRAFQTERDSEDGGNNQAPVRQQSSVDVGAEYGRINSMGITPMNSIQHNQRIDSMGITPINPTQQIPPDSFPNLTSIIF